MSRVSVLAAGRRKAEAGMKDECVITRVTGATTDRETGQRVETRSTIYPAPGQVGRCRLQELQAFSRDTRPTPDQPMLARYRVLQLPVATSVGLLAGDDVQMTVSVNDPDALGKHYAIRDQSTESEATSRRVGVEEITG